MLDIGSDDLQLAFRRIKQDRRDDAWPDVVGFRDFEIDLEQNLATLEVSIADPGQYEARKPRGIDIPKRGYTLRPGISVGIDDRVVYQGLADRFAPLFDPEPCVYSNRLAGDHRSDRMFIPGVSLWVNFQDRIEELCSEYAYVVETDISAYFDHIDQNLLFSRIRDLFNGKLDSRKIEHSVILLKRLLSQWYQRGFGIPQIMDPSSFFGNLYLDEIDKWMLRHDYEFVRYVDDIRLFAHSEPHARRQLAGLIVKLREMGLFVGSAKTSIKTTKEVAEQLVAKRKTMSEIEEDLEAHTRSNLEAAASSLENLFTSLITSPAGFDDRLFRYCVNRFKRLKVSDLGNDDIYRIVTSEILKHLEKMPYITDTFVDYLSLFPDDGDIQSAICDFLESPYNTYEWQEMLLLEFLTRCTIESSNEERVLRLARSLAGRATHIACQEKAFVLWGKNGDYQDRREIRARYHDTEAESVRRAIVVALQEMQKRERDNFLNKTVSRDSRVVQMTARYVQELQKPTYHYYNPPRGYDVISVDTIDSDDLGDMSSEFFLY